MSVRIVWTTVVVACLVAALLLLLNDYVGYSGVFLTVGGAAAINLLPTRVTHTRDRTTLDVQSDE